MACISKILIFVSILISSCILIFGKDMVNSTYPWDGIEESLVPSGDVDDVVNEKAVLVS